MSYLNYVQYGTDEPALADEPKPEAKKAPAKKVAQPEE